jgi:hypothetical protein
MSWVGTLYINVSDAHLHQMQPVHTLPLHLFDMCFDIIIECTPVSSYSFRISDKTCYLLSLLWMPPVCPSLPWFNDPNITWLGIERNTHNLKLGRYLRNADIESWYFCLARQCGSATTVCAKTSVVCAVKKSVFGCCCVRRIGAWWRGGATWCAFKQVLADTHGYLFLPVCTAIWSCWSCTV